jgi:hypothetical protein
MDNIELPEIVTDLVQNREWLAHVQWLRSQYFRQLFIPAVGFPFRHIIDAKHSSGRFGRLCTATTENINNSTTKAKL